MATKSNGSARTAPKGRATPARGSGGTGASRLSSTVQWVIAVIIIVVVLVGIMYLLRDESADAQSGMAVLLTAPALARGS